MADTPGFPDCNTAMLIDSQKRLWLFWPSDPRQHLGIVPDELPRSSRLRRRRPPKWELAGVDLRSSRTTFSDEMLKGFEAAAKDVARVRSRVGNRRSSQGNARATSSTSGSAGSRAASRRCCPAAASCCRSTTDTFSISIMAISDDEGKTW